MDLYSLYQQPQILATGLIILAIWILVWKGLALWHAARNGQKGWYVAILILNTLGLLPIIYLIWFKNRNNKEEKSTEIRVESVEESENKKTKKNKKPSKK